ncbi:hypothetical protein DWB84_09270 [Saccharophagus sp. K07]|nr:hypothetical protein [Saccharophagus sp. K07]
MRRPVLQAYSADEGVLIVENRLNQERFDIRISSGQLNNCHMAIKIGLADNLKMYRSSVSGNMKKHFKWLSLGFSLFAVLAFICQTEIEESYYVWRFDKIAGVEKVEKYYNYEGHVVWSA